MRSTIIPAQITTVEDKIMGNLNLTQIMLLMTPVLWTTLVYSIFLPYMQFAWYKLPLILIITFACLILSLRVKNRLVLQWLTILLRFTIRPKYFVFNKNDAYLRLIDMPVVARKVRIAPTKVVITNHEKKSYFSLADMLTVEKLLSDPSYTFSIKSAKKGGLHVAFKQIR